MMENALDSFKKVTKVVVDSSDFKSLAKFKPIDATTNPSLIIKSINSPHYQGIVNRIHKKYSDLKSKEIAREIVITFAEEILKVIPGRVSIEVDPSIANNSSKTEWEAFKIIESCSSRGIPQSKVLIKIPATWEGITAAKNLEREKINCNLTLLFSETQALACADSGVKMISPFVGRISDWWRNKGILWDAPFEDPGVKFARSVFCHLKKNKYSTEVMAASFRSVEQVLSLAGLELLTISPKLLSAMMKLPPQDNIVNWIEEWKNKTFQLFEINQKYEINHHNFSKLMVENEMANQKLKEGITVFKNDGKKLIQAVEAANQID